MRRSTKSWSGPPLHTGHLPSSVRRLLAEHNGIVSTAELRAIGVTPSTLDLFRTYASLQAVRQGWHCAPEVPDVVRLAWRFGGPLACMSALEYDQAVALDELRPGGLSHVERIAQPLHVCVPRGTARVPSPELLAARWGIPVALAPIIHWSTADYRSGDRRTVSIAVAQRQSRSCSQR
jgi:hypothetical protein